MLVINLKRHFIIFIFLILLLPCPSWAEDLNGRQIMERVDARDDGDNQVSDMEMILIDKNGKKRGRKIRAFGKDKGEDTLRLMFFMAPADVEDTAFLTYDYDQSDKDDDQWMYLPALRKTKRIATSDKSGSFMGSDFTYSDMTKRDLDDYDYTLLKEVKVRDADTWLIQAVPRTKDVIDRTGYTKSVLYVQKDNFMVIRGVHWVKKGNRLKYMDVKKLILIDGIWVATEMHMTTRKGKTRLHKTIMTFENVRFNQDIKEDFFSIRRMEKGL
jgi:outer membrane lipoprotein-sorting protein